MCVATSKDQAEAWFNQRAREGGGWLFIQLGAKQARISSLEGFRKMSGVDPENGAREISSSEAPTRWLTLFGVL